MFNGDNDNNWQGMPFLVYGGIKDVDGLKMSSDIYKVYVNDDFIGEKKILTQNDDVHDLEKYLKNQGFHDFDADLTGNRFHIKLDKYQAKHMKDILNVYLHLR